MIPGFVRRFDGRTGALFAALTLSTCILLQMLGVPVTMLCPDVSPDILETSISEGFSVPASPISLDRPTDAMIATDRLSPLHIPVLASAAFHPPL
ncbi:MAG TPA: hypothetical protein VJ746_08915 [Nitrospira sp.]|nr:hypothetical protein [Nitrospira sp.]